MFTGLSSCRLFNNAAHLSRNTFVLSAPVCPAERGDAVRTLLPVISFTSLAPLTSLHFKPGHLPPLLENTFQSYLKAQLSIIGIYSTKVETGATFNESKQQSLPLFYSFSQVI